MTLRGDMAGRKLGLIVNPVAGMGGSVGLKGTDGDDILERAIVLGATPESPKRAVVALKALISVTQDFVLFTCPGQMGESESRQLGLKPRVIGSIGGPKTTPDDTRREAENMLREGTDLLLFAGGDGTARDLCAVVGTKMPVLGIPSGVKMHSGVFAINAESAGRLAASYLKGELDLCEEDVLDIDETDYRRGVLSAKFYGHMSLPCGRSMLQGVKVGGATSQTDALVQIAWSVIDDMDDETTYFIGPGSTTKRIMVALGLEYTLLGVDVVRNRRLMALDANEEKLLEFVKEGKTHIVVTPIGGQGFIFGRGNQQFSGRAIRGVGKDGIIVVATEGKIAALSGRPLLVDTGDASADALLRGYIRVLTGYRTAIMCRVS